MSRIEILFSEKEVSIWPWKRSVPHIILFLCLAVLYLWSFWIETLIPSPHLVTYKFLFSRNKQPSAFLQRCKIPPTTNVLDRTLNPLMMRHSSWSFGECGAPLHCRYNWVHSDPEWLYLLGSCLCVEYKKAIIF